MKYLLMIYNDETEVMTLPKDKMEQRLGAYGAFIEAMNKAGVCVAIDRLQPSSNATTVRMVDGKAKVLNGPYAETKEQLGGYILIDVPDLDAALAWAARCPGAGHGIMEIRPVWSM